MPLAARRATADDLVQRVESLLRNGSAGGRRSTQGDAERERPVRGRRSTLANV